MTIRGIVFVGVVACFTGILSPASAEREDVGGRSMEAEAAYKQGERTVVLAEMPEELRAAIPQRGASLPRPDVVRALRRQQTER